MWLWIILGAVLLFVIFLVGSFVRIYRGMFSVNHYREVASAVERIRRGAGERPFLEGMEIDELAGLGDPRTMVTSKSLAISYTITEEKPNFLHHIALSTPRAGYTTHAAGESFVSFIVWCLGLDPADCESFAGPSSYHLVFTIPEEEQAAFVEHPLSLSDEIGLETIRGEIQQARESIDFFDATDLIEQAPSRSHSPSGSFGAEGTPDNLTSDQTRN